MRLIVSLTAAVSALALAACQPADDATPPGDTPPASGQALTAEGWNTLRIGMTLDEVTVAMGPDSDPEAVGGAEPEICDQFRPERAPEGLLVMIEQGVLTRISIMDSSTLRTDRGFGLGSTGAEVEAAYGDAAIVEAHNYIGLPAEYITVWATGRDGAEYVQDPAARGIRYETDENGVVTLIHVGGPSIQYVEGCA